MNAESLRDLADQFPFVEQPLGQRRLIRIELPRPSEPYSSLLSRNPPGARSLADQIAFKLGDAGELLHLLLHHAQSPWIREG